MRSHLLNAACGVLDYVAYPVGMLLVAPIVLHHRGGDEFGVWSVATAVVSTGAILASGFGDAGIQCVAEAREMRSSGRLLAAVRAMFTIHLSLGVCLSAIGLLFAGLAARMLIRNGNAELQHVCVVSLRLASLLIALRAIEAVCISTQRAFEKYGKAVGVSVAARILSLAAAAVAALTGHSVAVMLGAAFVVQIFSVGAQICTIAHRLGWQAVTLSFCKRDMSAILRDGRYTWMVAASGVAFAYADRILLGVSRGAHAVVVYALCVQLAQPIYGLAANGLHFVFPYLARMQASAAKAELRLIVHRATAWNVGLVALLCALVVLGGRRVLMMWVGVEAQQEGALLPIIVASFGLLSASVVATYGLLAVRQARQVALHTGIGALGTLITMPWLLKLWGPFGLAVARLEFSFACVLLYVPLFRYVNERYSLRTNGIDDVVPHVAGGGAQ